MALNYDIVEIKAWYNQWGMKLSPSKTQDITISKSRNLFPSNSNIILSDTLVKNYEYLKSLSVTFDTKFAFKLHLCLIDSSVPQKIYLLRKCT